MSFDNVLMVDGTDIGGVDLRPEDILSDELVGMMNDLNHTVTSIDENDPLYQQHLAFKQEIENRPLILSLEDVKYEDSHEYTSAIENVSFADTDRLACEHLDEISDPSMFISNLSHHPANYGMLPCFFPFYGKTEKNSILKLKNVRGEVEEMIINDQMFVPEEIIKAFKGHLYEIVG